MVFGFGFMIHLWYVDGWIPGKNVERLKRAGVF
jgi:hypothetical protein